MDRSPIFGMVMEGLPLVLVIFGHSKDGGGSISCSDHEKGRNGSSA